MLFCRSVSIHITIFSLWVQELLFMPTFSGTKLQCKTRTRCTVHIRYCNFLCMVRLSWLGHDVSVAVMKDMI